MRHQHLHYFFKILENCDTSILPSTSIASPEYTHKQIVVGANSLSRNSSRKLFSDIQEYAAPVSNSISTGEPSNVIDTLIGGVELGDCKVPYMGNIWRGKILANTHFLNLWVVKYWRTYFSKLFGW